MAAQTRIRKSAFGRTPSGEDVDLYTLATESFEVSVMTHGGIIVSLRTPDRRGDLADITLGFDDLEGYLREGNKAFFGGIIGRYANRIANGRFELGGRQYQVPINDPPNALHGGKHGFDTVYWLGKQVDDAVEMTYVSRDGEQGFPGTLTAKVRFSLAGSELRIDYHATTDQPTVVNLTSHPYFNLSGEGADDVLAHEVKIAADRYTPVNSTLIPTGELASVEGTPFDFREPTAIGARIEAPSEQLRFAKGYDHNWVLNPRAEIAFAAEAHDATSGRWMTVLTDQPGVQFYSGNHLDGSIRGKRGHIYGFRSGFAFETQNFPDAPNHPGFPSAVLKPGEQYRTSTIYRFGIR